MLAMMLAGGFYTQSIGPHVSWIRYFSFVNYSYPLMVQLEFFAGRTFQCETERATTHDAYGACPVTSEAVLSSLDPVSTNPAVNVLMLIVLGSVYRVMSYVFLRRNTKITKASFDWW
jgi:hypothetical protein